MPSHALILLCRTSAIAEKLMGVYGGLLSDANFPYRFQIQVNPPDAVIQKLTASNHCLFFLEVPKDNDPEAVMQISSAIQEYRPKGHQLVLITDQTVDYLDLAIRFNVGNVLFTDSLEASTVGALTQRLLSNDFFGFGPFFPNRYERFEQHTLLTGIINRAGLVERHFASFMESLAAQHRSLFQSQMSELLTNALAYGVLGITEEQRDHTEVHLPAIVEIPPGREVRVTIVQDDEKYGISVKDPGGSLTLLRILQKLRRHTAPPGSLPIGIDDLTGRGLFIVSRQTRLVINILRGRQTEVILLSYFNEQRNRYKSLIINEKYPSPLDMAN